MLNNKVIVVTGGAGLLGSCFCSAIAERGGTAIIADLNIAAATAVAEKIRANGGEAEALFLNITDSVSVDNLIASLVERYGRIDAVVNNAYPRNKNWGQKLEDVTYTDFCENVNMHLGGYFLVAQRFALCFRAHKCGHIVNIASIYGTMAPRFEIYADTNMTMSVEYAAIKSAVIHLSRYFAQYFKTDGVRCNSISPGGIFDHQPEVFRKKYDSHCGVNGMLDPQDLIGTLVFLLSDSSQYINGQNIIVDDGFTV